MNEFVTIVFFVTILLQLIIILKSMHNMASEKRSIPGQDEVFTTWDSGIVNNHIYFLCQFLHLA